MRFEIVRRNVLLPSRILMYRPNEFSFNVEPINADSFTSVLLNDLNIELDALGRIIGTGGLCPHTTWKKETLLPPNSTSGEVIFTADGPLTKGVSFRLNAQGRWPALVDLPSKQLCLRGPGTTCTSTEILPGVIVDLTDRGDLCSLWLHFNIASNGHSSPLEQSLAG